MRLPLRTLLIVLGLAAITVLAWVWSHSRRSRTVAFYGNLGARLIRSAATVKILNGAQDNLVDITGSPDLVTARSLLLDDENYDWSASDLQSDGTDASIQFHDDSSLTIFFDFEHNTVQTYPDMNTARLTLDAADQWKEFFLRQFSSAKK